MVHCGFRGIRGFIGFSVSDGVIGREGFFFCGCLGLENRLLRVYIRCFHRGIEVNFSYAIYSRSSRKNFSILILS